MKTLKKGLLALSIIGLLNTGHSAVLVTFHAAVSFLQKEIYINPTITILGGIVAYIGYGGGLTFVALDESTFGQENIYQGLREHLSLIDNPIVLEEFSELLYQRYQNEMIKTGMGEKKKLSIGLKPEEISEVLSRHSVQLSVKDNKQLVKILSI